jgi:cytochrome c-type biogenesis protein CcmF
VLTSVHSFASDPARGVFILALLVVAVGGSLLLYAWRAPALQPGGLFAPISREGGLLLNNLLLATATATVLLGTLYPLALEAVGGAKISVGPPFYNATFVPLIMPLLLALPIGSMLAWKRGDLMAVLPRLWLAAAVGVAAFVLHLLLTSPRSALAALGIGLGVWAIMGALSELADRLALLRAPLASTLSRARGMPRSAWAMTLAHVGIGVVILGVTATATGRTERLLVMQDGQRVELAGYDVVFQGVAEVRGPNYIAQRGTFAVSYGGSPVSVLHSEKRFFPVEGMPTTEAGIDTGLFRDLYLVLGDPAAAGGWTVRLYHNPLAFWIWGGAGLMGLAGLISLSDRRLRVGAPRPARARLAAT